MRQQAACLTVGAKREKGDKPCWQVGSSLAIHGGDGGRTEERMNRISNLESEHSVRKRAGGRIKHRLAPCQPGKKNRTCLRERGVASECCECLSSLACWPVWTHPVHSHLYKDNSNVPQICWVLCHSDWTRQKLPASSSTSSSLRDLKEPWHQMSLTSCVPVFTALLFTWIKSWF